MGGGRSPKRTVAAAAGRSDHGCVRVCALVAVIACGVLAVPATARSDPFGTVQALQQANTTATTYAQAQQQADTAIGDAQALASQELAATSSLVSKAVVGGPASAAGVEKEAAKTVSGAIASVRATAKSAMATPPTQRETSPASPPVSHPRRHRTSPRAHRGAASVAPAGWARPAASGTSSLRTTGAAPSAGPTRATARSRGSTTSDRGGRPGPHRLPPLPVPSQGMNGAAEGGGSAPAPLLVAALAAALFLVLFEFLSRLLPRSALRKPRRLVLPPWHPG
jgi:hypothetical protein